MAKNKMNILDLLCSKGLPNFIIIYNYQLAFGA